MADSIAELCDTVCYMKYCGQMHCPCVYMMFVNGRNKGGTYWKFKDLLHTYTVRNGT